ncbi:hypothetical protein GALMADRAFT_265265 [Galerina marginata CBS 339.88]|uniref:Uncharacterized protein n=1 Tax=Galerina marginata (strain CBS 339.88) TaxID=685588 RepID=A0A067TA52_GALM3|nr:hypothetical protein GALMADRAFT_265265 [Galerina marginata CBS 339.88]
MATYMHYFIPLNQSTLLFFPSDPVQNPNVPVNPKSDGKDLNNKSEENGGYVVQVMIKQARRNVIKEMTTFFLVQYEITKVVESIVFAHIFSPMPPEVRIEGRGYVLKGRRRSWDYGKTLNLRWGEDATKQCEDKWVFLFELVPELAYETKRALVLAPR